MNKTLFAVNKNYSQTDSGVGDGSVDVSPTSLVGSDPPPLLPVRYTENGRANKAKDLPPPVERFPIKVEDLENYVVARQVNDCEELRKEYRVCFPTSTVVSAENIGSNYNHIS